ncbi:MAG: hypothetical protein EBT09_10585 [Actinobacteria bacterium]|nr:hypothetical protein [Actinomycetota bacterium]
MLGPHHLMEIWCALEPPLKTAPPRVGIGDGPAQEFHNGAKVGGGIAFDHLPIGRVAARWVASSLRDDCNPHAAHEPPAKPTGLPPERDRSCHASIRGRTRLPRTRFP